MNTKLPDNPIPSEELNGPKMHDLSHERDERCVPMAKRLIEILASMEKMPVGSHVNDESAKVYDPVIRLFLEELLNNDIRVMDVTYIFNLARQALQAVQTTIDENLNQHMNRVTEVVYGLPFNDYNEVTIKQLDNVVTKKGEIEEVWKPILNK